METQDTKPKPTHVYDSHDCKYQRLCVLVSFFFLQTRRHQTWNCAGCLTRNIFARDSCAWRILLVTILWLCQQRLRQRIWISFNTYPIQLPRDAFIRYDTECGTTSRLGCFRNRPIQHRRGCETTRPRNDTKNFSCRWIEHGCLPSDSRRAGAYLW